jgi:uncharacterized membrane protein
MTSRRYHLQPYSGRILDALQVPRKTIQSIRPILPDYGGFMKSRPPPKLIARSDRKRPRTFADIRRNAEKRLKLGLQLDFEQIMADIAAIRAAH